MEEATEPGQGVVLVRWLFGVGILIAFSALGNLVQHVVSLPIPGSTIGMIALLALFATPVRRWLLRTISPAADSLVAVLPLLLVPLAVGIVGSFGPLAEHALGLAAALVVGWLVTFLTAAFVADLLMRRRRRS